MAPQAHPLHVLAWTSVIYILMLPLRFTEAGQEAANRSGEFLYVGIAIVVATMLVGGTTGMVRGVVRLSRGRHRASGRDRDSVRRLCRDVHGRGRRVVELRSQTVPSTISCRSTGGDDTRRHRGGPLVPPGIRPNHRIATDITTGLAFVTDGDQDVLSGASDGAHLWRIFFPSKMARGVYSEPANSKVQFVVIQQQLTDGVPPSAVVPVYDAGEPALDDVRPLPVASDQKFASAFGVTKVYGSRTIVIYRIDLDQARYERG